MPDLTLTKTEVHLIVKALQQHRNRLPHASWANFERRETNDLIVFLCDKAGLEGEEW